MAAEIGACRIELAWNPDVGLRGGKVVARRHHADHFPSNAIHLHHAADDRGIGAEDIPPERITQQHNPRAARTINRLVFLRRRPTAALRGKADEFKGARR
jgi:hypothetical protein